MFSQRTHWNLQHSPLAETLEARRRSGGEILDLTESNPTAAGFAVDLASVAAALSSGATAAYQPISFGLPSARNTVANYYLHEHGIVDVDPGRVVLTVSTSEAYSFLFRLLCDPGDEVIFLQPSYPLFEFLAGLDDVILKPVGLFYDNGWHLDRTAIASAVTDRTKAVLLVHPNNPTGHFIRSADRGWFDDFCAARNLPLIVDEVFLDYSLGHAALSFLSTEANALTFVLSGLSKISGLPQMKVAWIAVNGPDHLVDPALARLDVIADTFLSVSTPMQMALPALLDVRRQIQPQIIARLETNLAALDVLLDDQGLVTRLDVEGGWYTTLRIPALEDSEAAAIRLLTDAGVYVHPGSFFGFGNEGILVVSLLTPEPRFAQGIVLLLKHIQNFE